MICFKQRKGVIVLSARITLEHSGKTEPYDAPATVGELIKKLGLSPEEVLVSVNGELATEDTRLRDGDEVKIISVISGG